MYLPFLSDITVKTAPLIVIIAMLLQHFPSKIVMQKGNKRVHFQLHVPGGITRALMTQPRFYNALIGILSMRKPHNLLQQSVSR